MSASKWTISNLSAKRETRDHGISKHFAYPATPEKPPTKTGGNHPGVRNSKPRNREAPDRLREDESRSRILCAAEVTRCREPHALYRAAPKPGDAGCGRDPAGTRGIRSKE